MNTKNISNLARQKSIPDISNTLPKKGEPKNLTQQAREKAEKIEQHINSNAAPQAVFRAPCHLYSILVSEMYGRDQEYS